MLTLVTTTRERTKKEFPLITAKIFSNRLDAYNSMCAEIQTYESLGYDVKMKRHDFTRAIATNKTLGETVYIQLIDNQNETTNN